MLERATARTLPLVGRMADATPVATSCCNACRSCLTANIAGLLAAAAAFAVRPLRRRLAR
jgi:hypothetical protein